MTDAKEQELTEAWDEAVRKWDEAYRNEDYRKRCEADREWVETYRKLRKYRKSKAQQGGKAGGMTNTIDALVLRLYLSLIHI